MLDVDAADGKLLSYDASVSTIKNSVTWTYRYGSDCKNANMGWLGTNTVYMMYGYIFLHIIGVNFFLV
jgi:hypothetical protein